MMVQLPVLAFRWRGLSCDTVAERAVEDSCLVASASFEQGSLHQGLHSRCYSIHAGQRKPAKKEKAEGGREQKRF